MPPPPPSPQEPDLPCDLGSPGEMNLKLSVGSRHLAGALPVPVPAPQLPYPGAQFPAAFH